METTGSLPHTFNLNDSQRVLYLEPLSECECGLLLNVVTLEHNSPCRWFMNGTQASAGRSYVYANECSILFRPFEQNLSHTTITCFINATQRFTVVIGDVYSGMWDVHVHVVIGVSLSEPLLVASTEGKSICISPHAGPSPSPTVVATDSMPNLSDLHVHVSVAIIPSVTVHQTTLSNSHNSTPTTSPNVTSGSTDTTLYVGELTERVYGTNLHLCIGPCTHALILLQ